MVALSRWLLDTTLGASFAVSVASLASYQITSSRLAASALDRLSAIANQRIEHVDAWLSDQRTVLRQHLSDPIITSSARELLASPRRSRLVLPSPAELALDQALRPSSAPGIPTSLLSNGGIIIYSTQSNLLGYYRPLTNTTTFLEETELETEHYRLYTDGDTGLPAITLAVPLYDAQKKSRNIQDRVESRLGVLAMGLDLAALNRRVQRDRASASVSIRLVGETGLGTITEIAADPEAASSSSQDRMLPSLSSSAILRAMDGASGRGSYLDAKGAPVLGVYRWIPAMRMALMVETPQLSTYAPARRIASMVFMIGNGIVWIAFLSVVWRRDSTTAA